MISSSFWKTWPPVPPPLFSSASQSAHFLHKYLSVPAYVKGERRVSGGAGAVQKWGGGGARGLAIEKVVKAERERGGSSLSQPGRCPVTVKGKRVTWQKHRQADRERGRERGGGEMEGGRSGIWDGWWWQIKKSRIKRDKMGMSCYSS